MFSWVNDHLTCVLNFDSISDILYKTVILKKLLRKEAFKTKRNVKATGQKSLFFLFKCMLKYTTIFNTADDTEHSLSGPEN